MRRAALPLDRFPLVLTRSLAEATLIQSRINSPVHAERLDRKAPFAWRANRATWDTLHIVASRYAGGVRGVTANVDGQYSLVLARKQGIESRQRGQGALVVPGRRAAIISHSMPATFHVQTGYEGIQVSIPSQRLESALETLTGTGRTAALRFELGFDITRGPGAELVRLVEFCVESLDAGASLLDAPIIQSQLAEALVLGLLLGIPHDHAHLLRQPTRDVAPRYVHRAEEFMDANAHRHVAMADLVAATGVSARALFAGFRAHRGSSPMTFLRARRFDLARRRLLASPATTVTEVALACGFEHLGRFSIGYRARFGEGPAETLRRRRRG